MWWQECEVAGHIAFAFRELIYKTSRAASSNFLPSSNSPPPKVPTTFQNSTGTHGEGNISHLN